MDIAIEQLRGIKLKTKCKFMIIIIYSIVITFNACDDSGNEKKDTAKYIVIFDSQCSEVIEPQYVVSGSKLTEENNLTNGILIFSGWFQEETYETPWDFNIDRVTHNMILYAKWMEHGDLLTLSLISSNTAYEIMGVADCSGIVYIPANYQGLPVSRIGYEAFIDCIFLSSITIPSSVDSIGDYAFYGCTSLNSIILPEGITSIGDCAFRACISLLNITIPSSVTNTGDGVFYGCTSLSTITIQEGVTSIGNSEFDSCYSLSSITIPSSIINIGNSAFESCYSLSNITIPSNVENIGDWAFYNCTSLISLSMEPMAAPVVDDNYTFSGLTGCTLHIHSTATGYDVAPWNNATIFSRVLPDL